ncbi:MAG TPA: DHA2 family efflux MFS transporter permease subunit [Bryobacteraceae bacterium]|nr:DHA2 family efflux MFS transporter permease subunit [Bryobacteraceae bacterium]
MALGAQSLGQDLLLRNPKLARWLVAVAVMASATMELVDSSAVNVSLPYIAGNLSASINEATWVLTSYLVSNAIVLPLSGWLANYFGRKRLLIMAVVGFTGASICCGLAPNLPSLILFRVLQGAEGGSLQPTTRAVMLEAFPREERGHAMAFWGVGIIVAPIVAPMLGGWLTTDYSWRWIFFINVPVSVVGILLVELFVFDPPYIRRRAARIDYWGMGMLATGIAALQIMLDKGQEDDWFGSSFIVIMAVIAVAGLVGFVIWELRTRDPIVHFSLFRHRTFAVGTALAMIAFLAVYGSIVLIPLFMQTLLNFPAFTAGEWNTPRGIATLIVMPVAGFLIGRRWDMRALIFTGLLVAGVGSYEFSHLNLSAGPWDFVVPQMIMGAGLSFMFVPLATITVDPIPAEEMGYATSLTGLSRNIGSGIGISIFTTVLARRQQFHQLRLVANLSRHQPEFAHTRSAIEGYLAQHGNSLGMAAKEALAALYFQVVRAASLMSYLDGFRIVALLFVLVAPLVWLMRKPQFKKRGAAAD